MIRDSSVIVSRAANFMQWAATRRWSALQRGMSRRITQQCSLYSYGHRPNLANNIVVGGGGVAKSIRNINLWRKRVRKRCKIGFNQNIHTPLSPTLSPIFLFVHLQLSSQEKLFLGRKNIRGYLPPSLAPSTKFCPCIWGMKQMCFTVFNHLTFYSTVVTVYTTRFNT
jgi:hypothetical protein